MEEQAFDASTEESAFYAHTVKDYKYTQRVWKEHYPEVTRPWEWYREAKNVKDFLETLELKRIPTLGDIVERGIQNKAKRITKLDEKFSIISPDYLQGVAKRIANVTRPVEAYQVWIALIHGLHFKSFEVDLTLEELTLRTGIAKQNVSSALSALEACEAIVRVKDGRRNRIYISPNDISRFGLKDDWEQAWRDYCVKVLGVTPFEKYEPKPVKKLARWQRKR